MDQGFGLAGLVTTVFGTRDAVARAVAVAADDSIVVAGYLWNGAMNDFTVARYDSDGVLDTGFGAEGAFTVTFFGGSDRAECVAIQPDCIVVAGSAANFRSNNRHWHGSCRNPADAPHPPARASADVSSHRSAVVRFTSVDGEER